MMMIAKLLRFGRRQLHTITSREIIKPSSPTPSHLHTYNLSEIDQLFKPKYVPLILLYPNNGDCTLTSHEKARVLKKSLSLSLTQYYPFAGRFHKPEKPAYVDCNDQGVVFVEANHDSPLTTIQLTSEQDGKLDQLFADDLYGKNSHSTNVVGVKLNHFTCGGVAVAISMSHFIGDARTFGSFVSHWASVARFGSTDHEEVLPLNPHFLQSPRTDSVLQESHVEDINVNWVTKKFVFPNSKLSDLKKKVIDINNPTRLEVLISLLYKTAVAAATTKSGSFQSSCLLFPVDIRSKFEEKLSLTTVGNLLSGMMVPTRHQSEVSLSLLVSEIKKEKLRLEGIQSVQHASQKLMSLFSKLENDVFGNVIKRSYTSTSVCGFPFYKVDFGWGKPVGASILLLGVVDGNTFELMDTPHGDGIEANVIMEKEEMQIFENDKEMLSFLSD